MVYGILYMARDTSLCDLHAETIDRPRSVTIAVFRTKAKCLTLNQYELQELNYALQT